MAAGVCSELWGLKIMTKGEPLFPCEGPSTLIYSASESFSYVAYAQGYRSTRGILEHRAIVEPGDRVQDFQITIGELLSLR